MFVKIDKIVQGNVPSSVPAPTAGPPSSPLWPAHHGTEVMQGRVGWVPHLQRPCLKAQWELPAPDTEGQNLKAPLSPSFRPLG